MLRISIHSPPGHVNRDGTATGRECGPEWVGPHGSCVPALHRVGTGRPLSHANEVSVTSSTPTPTPARPRTNTSPKWASVCGKFQRFSRYVQADSRESVRLVSLRNASSSPPQWGISLAEYIQGTWIIAVQLLPRVPGCRLGLNQTETGCLQWNGWIRVYILDSLSLWLLDYLHIFLPLFCTRQKCCCEVASFACS